MSLKFEKILWDFDGTLTDSSRDVWESILWAGEKFGARIGGSFMEDDANLSKSLNEIFQMLRPFPGQEKFPIYEAYVNYHYRSLNGFSNTRLYKGIKELLNELLQNSAENIIVTNKPRIALEKLLYSKGWFRFFNNWICPDSLDACGQELGNKENMIGSLVYTNTAEREKYVLIGDSCSDVIAARSNRIDCIGVTYGDGDSDALQLVKPTYCVDSVESIRGILFADKNKVKLGQE